MMKETRADEDDDEDGKGDDDCGNREDDQGTCQRRVEQSMLCRKIKSSGFLKATPPDRIAPSTLVVSSLS